MANLYRTPGPWGAGTGANLPAVSIDANFHGLDQRLLRMEDPTGQVDIVSISQNLDWLTVNYSDSSEAGPYQIPKALFRWTGAWQPGHAYTKGDLFTVGAPRTLSFGVYVYLVDATSPASFHDTDPHIQLVLTPPDKILPVDGPASAILRKVSDAEADIEWHVPGLEEFSDFTPATTSRADTDVMTWDGFGWTNETPHPFTTIDQQGDVHLLSPREPGQVLTWRGHPEDWRWPFSDTSSTPDGWYNAIPFLVLNSDDLGAPPPDGRYHVSDVFLPQHQDIPLGQYLVWAKGTIGGNNYAGGWIINSDYSSSGVPPLDWSQLTDTLETGAETDQSILTFVGDKWMAFDRPKRGINVQINNADLVAGKDQTIVMPCAGYVWGIRIVIQTSIGTGGTLTLYAGGTTAVVGTTISVTDGGVEGLTSVGQGPTPPTSIRFNEGDIMVIRPAGFSGFGAINVLFVYF
jgi:hypothetical protein